VEFKPKNYEEALAKKIARDQKRKPKTWKSTQKRWTSTTKTRKPLKTKPDPKLIAWSKKIRERDEHTCQWPKLGGCRTCDTRIEAHHIAERSLRPDLKYVLENGISLCHTHHMWLPLHRQEAIAMKLLSEETYEKHNTLR